MRHFRYTIFSIIVGIFFFACQKDLLIERDIASSGTFVKEASGNCSAPTIVGIYKTATVLTSSNYIELNVSIAVAGTYAITTDTLNGIYFRKDSVFVTTGPQLVRLIGYGTPTAAGMLSFTAHYDGISSCAVPVTVLPAGTSTIAAFTLDGAPSACTTPNIQGSYVAGTVLTAANRLTVGINVSSPGTYTLSTAAVNGISFSATGTFTVLGSQNIILAGSGTPVAAGTNSMSISGTVAGCSFPLTVTSGTTPSGSKIFYDVDNYNGTFLSYEIYSCDLDGSNEKKLTNFSANGTLQKWAIEPAFNADSTKIIFVLGTDIYGGQLMSMNLDGTGVTAIAPLLGSGVHSPFVYQNGQKIVFWTDTLVASFPGAPHLGQIFTANIDGTNIKKLTSVDQFFLPDGTCSNPFINKANNSITYFNETLGVYAMNADGSNKHVLVAGDGIGRSPRYSPDGTKLVYSGRVNATTNGHQEIFIANADGTGVTQLTNYSNNGTASIETTFPSFSKDGSLIYYTSEQNGIQQIYKMNLDGSGKTKITSGSLNRYDPLVK